jgi:hypothetical protein
MNFASHTVLPSCLSVDVFCPIVHVLLEFAPVIAGTPESLSDRLCASVRPVCKHARHRNRQKPNPLGGHTTATDSPRAAVREAD